MSPTSRVRTQRSRGGQAVPRPARKALEELQAQLHGVVARVRSAKLLSDEELREFRAVLKAGAPKKLGILTDALSVSDTTRRLLALYTARLAEHAIDLPLPSPASNVTVPLARANPRSPAELSARLLEERDRNLKIVAAMEAGCTAAEALKNAGIEVTANTKRGAQRRYRDYKNNEKLHDGRHTRIQAVTVMTPAMKTLAEALWLQFRGASADGIRMSIERHIALLESRLAIHEDISSEMLGTQVSAGPVRIPEPVTLRRFFKQLGPEKRTIREKGIPEWIRQHRPLVGVEWASRANEEWQVDHTPLDVWARVLDAGTGLWKAVRPTLTAIIDVYSRAILAVVVSARDPDAFTTTHALRMAILPKSTPGWTARGLPERLVLDNGPDFRAHSVTAILGAIGIKQVFCQNYMPDQKPHIEAWIHTITYSFLPILPGYTQGIDNGKSWTPGRVDGLLTVPQIRREIERWIVEEYHVREHGTTKRAPMELWEEGVPNIVVPPIRVLDALLLHQVERRIVRGVIRFTVVGGAKSYYYMPILLERSGSRVMIRYNPDDLQSVLVYDQRTGDFMGEAWDPRRPNSPYSRQDILVASRRVRQREMGYVQGLRERLPNYYAETATADRLAKKATGEIWDDARSTASDILTTLSKSEGRLLPAPGDLRILGAVESLDSSLGRLAGEPVAEDVARGEDVQVQTLKDVLRAKARARREMTKDSADNRANTSAEPSVTADITPTRISRLA